MVGDGLYVRANWQWKSRFLHTRTTDWEYVSSCSKSDRCEVIDVFIIDWGKQNHAAVYSWPFVVWLFMGVVGEGWPTACVHLRMNYTCTAVWSFITYNRLYMCYCLPSYKNYRTLWLHTTVCTPVNCLPSYKQILLPVQSWRLPASDSGRSSPASHRPGGKGDSVVERD